MLVFVIIGLLVVTGITLIIVGKKWKNENKECFGWILTIIPLIVAILIACYSVMWPRDVEVTKARYYEIQREVREVSELGGQECDLTILARKNLFEAIREMNETIDRNRIYCTSPWSGWFYSEEIGNLPKLNYIQQ